MILQKIRCASTVTQLPISAVFQDHAQGRSPLTVAQQAPPPLPHPPLRGRHQQEQDQLSLCPPISGTVVQLPLHPVPHPPADVTSPLLRLVVCARMSECGITSQTV